MYRHSVGYVFTLRPVSIEAGLDRPLVSLLLLGGVLGRLPASCQRRYMHEMNARVSGCFSRPPHRGQRSGHLAPVGEKPAYLPHKMTQGKGEHAH